MPRTKKSATEPSLKKERKARASKNDKKKSAPKIASAEILNGLIGNDTDDDSDVNQGNLIMLDEQGLTGIIAGTRQYEVWTRQIHKVDRVIAGKEYKKGDYTGWGTPSYFGRLEHALKHAFNHVMRENLKGSSVKTVEDILAVVQNIHKKFDVDIVHELVKKVIK